MKISIFRLRCPLKVEYLLSIVELLLKLLQIHLQGLDLLEP